MIIIISVLFLVILFLGSLYLLKPELFKTSINNKHNIPSQFNLSSEENTILVGCIFDSNNSQYVCLNKTNRGFEKVTFLDEYTDLDYIEEGFLLLEYKNSGWEKFDVNTEEIFSRWYQDISLTEESFYFEEEGGIHVDLYNYVQLKVIQKRLATLKEEEFKEQLTKFRSSPYFIMTPMRYDDWLYVCETTDNACVFWEKYQEYPYNVIKSVNSDETWDFNDLSKTWSRIRMLTIGLSSINPEYSEYENMMVEYEKFKEKFISIHQEVSEEELIFMGEYLPLWLVYYSDNLYEGWKNANKNDFYYLVDIYCPTTNCLEFKLNILYDEYKKKISFNLNSSIYIINSFFC